MAGARRRNGALEREVLGCLWAAGEPMTAMDVQAGLGAELAYTTVMTILSRLEAKGLVRRLQATARPHRFEPTVSEDVLTARRMMDLLGASEDRKAVLSRFVGSLPDEDRDALRKAVRPTRQ